MSVGLRRLFFLHVRFKRGDATLPSPHTDMHLISRVLAHADHSLRLLPPSISAALSAAVARFVSADGCGAGIALTRRCMPASLALSGEGSQHLTCRFARSILSLFVLHWAAPPPHW